MGFVSAMAQIALGMITFIVGWQVFGYILKNGRGGMREFLDTLTLILKSIGHWIRMRCLGYLKREAERKEGVVEAHVE